MIGAPHIGSRVGAWVHEARGLATARPAPAITAVLFALAAVSEASVRAAGSGSDAQTAILICLLALASTLPPAALGLAAAAIAVTAVSVISLATFHTLTVAGTLTALIVLYQLGQQVTPVGANEPGTRPIDRSQDSPNSVSPHEPADIGDHGLNARTHAAARLTATPAPATIVTASPLTSGGWISRTIDS